MFIHTLNMGIPTTYVQGIHPKKLDRLIRAEAILLAVVLVPMPIYAVCVNRKQNPGTSPTLKGLALPEGLIRGMLALMSMGLFVNLLVLGPGAPEMKEFFDRALAEFRTLIGTSPLRSYICHVFSIH